MKISYHQWLLIETNTNPRNLMNSPFYKNTAGDNDVIGVDLGQPYSLSDLHEIHGTKGNISDLADKIFGTEPEELSKPATAGSTNAHKLFQRIKKGPDGTGFPPLEREGRGHGRYSEINKRYNISNSEAMLRMLAHGAYHYEVQAAFHKAGIIPKNFFKTSTAASPQSIRKRLAATNDSGYKDGFPPMQFAAFRDVTDPAMSAEGWAKFNANLKAKRQQDK